MSRTAPSAAAASRVPLETTRGSTYDTCGAQDMGHMIRVVGVREAGWVRQGAAPPWTACAVEAGLTQGLRARANRNQ